MSRIRELTARLPMRLDPPPWRAPLPNMTELAPGWRRHDRTHLEISLEHPADGRERTWEAWIFLPQSFRLDAHTCTENQLGSDIQSRMRFSAPPLDLREVGAEVERVAAAVGDTDRPGLVDELKVFACRVREAIARRTLEVRRLVEDHSDDRSGGETTVAEIESLVAETEDALAGLRSTLLPAAERALPDIAKTARWVDEHLSRSFESAMIKVAGDLAACEPPLRTMRARAREAAVAEARYRSRVGAGPAVSVDSATRDLEQVERRQHALKRLTSAVLWLRPEVRDARRGAEHGLHALAAGVAMTFAITAALIYGTPSDATDLWVWGGLVVLAYMGKDRLKAGLQELFSGHVARRFPNRRWIIRDRHDEREVATASEKYRFVGPGDLPDDVARFRAELQRDTLDGRIASDSILSHSKSVVVDAEAVRATDARFEAVTDILRIDVSRWLSHTDDPSRTVTLADPDSGELFESELPRAYDVTILHRVRLSDRATDPGWSAARVVVSRNGIRRVDQLDE